jgi:hypothetical protein
VSDRRPVCVSAAAAGHLSGPGRRYHATGTIVTPAYWGGVSLE